ncbi:MAG: hypothetical protein SFY67_16020 [Candidatus Melainabacteria bacterium]|nr:hypothetical protein [Candidatus Melainabacteria bacterium]
MSELVEHYFAILDSWLETNDLREAVLFELVEADFPVLDAEIERLIRSKKVSKVELAESAIDDLLVYFKMDINRYLNIFFEITKEYVPYKLFRAANEDNKMLLRKRLSEHNRMALYALAFCGDDFAVKQFAEWRKHLPPWIREEYTAIEIFTRDAGWELDEDEQKRLLYDPNCFAITVYHDDKLDTGLLCQRCNRAMLSIEFPDDKVGGRNHIPFCDLCNGRERIETPKWIKKSPSIGGTLRLKIDKNLRDPFFSLSQFYRSSYSQIGGIPCWIQDPEYPSCSKCARTMIFHAQINAFDLVGAKIWDTMYYVFYCEFCKEEFRVSQQFS